jgi:hypothetical protein
MNFEPDIRVCKQAQTRDDLASYRHHPASLSPPSRRTPSGTRPEHTSDASGVWDRSIPRLKSSREALHPDSPFTIHVHHPASPALDPAPPRSPPHMPSMPTAGAALGSTGGPRHHPQGTYHLPRKFYSFSLRFFSSNIRFAGNLLYLWTLQDHTRPTTMCPTARSRHVTANIHRSHLISTTL